MKQKGTLPCSFSQASIAFIPKPEKHTTTKKGNYRTISSINIDVKILNKLPENQI
jgi:hypothetical protein